MLILISKKYCIATGTYKFTLLVASWNTEVVICSQSLSTEQQITCDRMKLTDPAQK